MEQGVQPIFQPTYPNLEFIFLNIVRLFERSYELAMAFLFGEVPFDFAVLLSALKIIGWILTVVFAIAIFYVVRKNAQVGAGEETKYKELRDAFLSQDIEKEHNERWEKVQTLMDSHNESDWRLAIMEADSMLEEVVEKTAVPGDTLGERLKNTEPSDFLTLQNAWAAHKVRNRIAHEGSNYVLTKREAEESIRNYEKVFEEFHYI